MTGQTSTSLNCRSRNSPRSREDLDSLVDQNGWDNPPPIASPTSDGRNHGWKKKSCAWKTSQRLLSLYPQQQSDPKKIQPHQKPNIDSGNYVDEDIVLQAPPGSVCCPPLILLNRYILAAAGPVLSLYGDFADSAQRLQSASLPLRSTRPLTQYLLSSTEHSVTDATVGNLSLGGVLQMSFHEETCIIYVLTAESSVHQLKLILPSVDTTGETTDSDTSVVSRASTPVISLLQTFATNEFGATGFATLSDAAGSGVDVLSIGYNSGVVETWRVQQELQQQQHSQDQRQFRRRNKSTKLLFQGFLPQSIRSIAFIERQIRTQEDVGSEECSKGSVATSDERRKLGNEVDHGRIRDFYMVVTMQMDTKIQLDEEEQVSSSIVKVLDIKRILHRMSTMEPAQTSTISLDDYAVNPTPGMELVDITNVPSTKEIGLPKRFPILQTHRANSISIRGRPHGNCYPDDDTFVQGVSLALPDGTIAFFSISPTMFDAVGIVDENHQIQLSYPAIGCGELAIVDKRGNQVTYMACCLRAGTCYLLPLVEMRTEVGTNVEKDKDNSIISTFQFPQDVASDLQNVYLQDFTAGNLVLNDEGNFHPVLVYSWSGGVVDVYSCGLGASNDGNMDDVFGKSENDEQRLFVSRGERRALEDMIDNESLSLISQILIELRTGSKLCFLEEDVWSKVLHDLTPSNALTKDGLDIEGLCSESSRDLRLLLLSLAEYYDHGDI